MIIVLILGLLHGGLSFLLKEILYAGNPLDNWMGTVNTYFFGAGAVVLLVFILCVIWSALINDGDAVGCLAKFLGPLLGVICIITYVVFTLFIPDIIVAFKTNRFLYYAGSVIMIIDGVLGKLLASYFAED
jgi:hypothetical protein